MSGEDDSFEDALMAEVSDLQNVEDGTDFNDESTSDDLYTISSYGVDFNVDALVKRLRKKQYYIPEFQRKYVWSQNDASRFIESLLLGLPVPGLFLYKESDGPRHLIIDGQQRLKSLERFYDGIWNEKVFRLSGLKTPWNGCAHSDLSEDDRLRLDDAILHATIFKQDTPTDNLDSVYEVFERINTGGLKLSPQEIRTCIAHGNFNDFLFKLNENTIWRNIYGQVSLRLKDIELILRFFAFFDNRAQYKRPMKKFLTDYMTTHKDIDESEQRTKTELWLAVLSKISSSLSPRPFRPGGRALNAAFFDCFSVTIAHALQEDPELSDGLVLAAYNSLLNNDDFKKSIFSSTADEENVKSRFEAVEKAVHGAPT